jgi:hypothetical protein
MQNVAIKPYQIKIKKKRESTFYKMSIVPTSAICIHPTGPTSTEQDVPQVSGFYRKLLLGPRLVICEAMNFDPELLY